jgi:hypothetical protein
MINVIWSRIPRRDTLKVRDLAIYLSNDGGTYHALILEILEKDRFVVAIPEIHINDYHGFKGYLVAGSQLRSQREFLRHSEEMMEASQ